MFIKGDGSETEFFEDGHKFDRFDEAVAFCKRHNLKGMELVLREDTSKDEIAIQLASG